MSPFLIMVRAALIGTTVGMFITFIYIQLKKHPKDPAKKTYSLKDENKAFKLLKKNNGTITKDS